LIESLYEITLNADHRLTIPEVKKIMNANGLINQSAYLLCLKKMGVIIKVAKDPNNKATRFFLGLQIKDIEPELMI
jgi:hypothetical protein